MGPHVRRERQQVSLSRRRFLLAGAAAAGSAAALSAACAPPAPATPSTLTAPAGAPTVLPPAAPTAVPTIAPTPVPPLKVGVLVPYTESSIGVDIGLNQKRAAEPVSHRSEGQARRARREAG